MAKLPPLWRERVDSENRRKARGAFWVRVLKPSPLTRDELVAMFSVMLSKPEVRIEEQRLDYLIDCHNEAGQTYALLVDGWNPIGTGSITIRPTIRKLTWREIFQWIDEELQISKNLSPLRTWSIP